MIAVKKIDDNNFEVIVEKGGTTSHEVHLSDDYYYHLTEEKVSREKLIEESFKFLLEHESNTMILKEFELPLIQTYFPQYEEEIKNRIKS